MNNLDLEVTVGGTTYKGNVFSGSSSVAGGSADLKNNVESVFLPAGTSGNFTVTVRATGIAGDGVPGNADTTDQDFALVIYNGSQQAPTQPIINVTPGSLSFNATVGSSPASQTLAIANSGVGTLSWTASSGATWLTVTPASGTAPSTLTAQIDASTLAAGSYSGAITISATGATNTPVSVPVTLTVAPAGQATYDTTLKAPKCATVGAFCDSGTLLNGRATKGPESNAPNTINGTCADGTSGTYHSDESLDGLKVSTVDGTALAPGKSVRIDAKVWAYSTFSSDCLDLYSAASASSPSWTFIGTLSPTASGQLTLSTTFTLPAGTLQAIRGQFRYSGTAGTCTSGAYNDRDDLVFAVGP